MQTAPAHIAVAGSVNADLVFSLQRVPRAGETLAARGLAVHPGGKVRAAGATSAATCHLCFMSARFPCLLTSYPLSCRRVATRRQQRRDWASRPSLWHSWAAMRRRTCEEDGCCQSLVGGWNGRHGCTRPSVWHASLPGSSTVLHLRVRESGPSVA